jgi:hypothetical protein
VNDDCKKNATNERAIAVAAEEGTAASVSRLVAV